MAVLRTLSAAEVAAFYRVGAWRELGSAAVPVLYTQSNLP